MCNKRLRKMVLTVSVYLSVCLSICLSLLLYALLYPPAISLLLLSWI